MGGGAGGSLGDPGGIPGGSRGIPSGWIWEGGAGEVVLLGADGHDVDGLWAQRAAPSRWRGTK